MWNTSTPEKIQNLFNYFAFSKKMLVFDINYSVNLHFYVLMHL